MRAGQVLLGLAALGGAVAIGRSAAARGTLADAVYRRALADLQRGVHEEIGYNDGVRIRQYALRFGLSPGVGPWPVNWCALAFATWLEEACRELGRPMPIRGSAGAQATMHQFMEADLWAPQGELRPEHLVRGNVPVWRRYIEPHPDSWRGHIGVIEDFDALSGAGGTMLTIEGFDALSGAGGTMLTIEGNAGPAGDRVARMTRPIGDLKLLGVGLLSKLG